MASTTFGNGLEQQVTTPEEHKGYIAAQSYFQEVDTPANQAFLKKFLPKYGASSKYVTLAGHPDLSRHASVGARREEGQQHRSHEGDRGAREQHQLHRARPARRRSIRKTHHCSLDVYIAEAQNRTFKVLESWPQQTPPDTAAVCDLKKNPNDNQQYVIDVKS